MNDEGEYQLYWSGYLDTETYEEPYSMANGYDVSLTFSDFGVLDRLKSELVGVQPLSAIINECLNKAAIEGEIEYHLATTNADGYTLDLSNLFINMDNFADEEDETMTLREILEECLR